MIHYYFDYEEKEYVAVTRPPRYTSHSNGGRPLFPAEIYEGQQKKTAAARTRAGRGIPKEKGVKK